MRSRARKRSCWRGVGGGWGLRVRPEEGGELGGVRAWDSREAESVTRDMASVVLSGMASSTVGWSVWRTWL